MKIMSKPERLIAVDAPDDDISAGLAEACLETLHTGHPIQIFSCSTDDQPRRLNMEAIESILDKVGSRPVAIVSVNGLERVGKSTLLNFCLHYQLLSDSAGDLYQIPVELPGFEWRPGCSPTTAGMAMWSEPFFVRDEESAEIAVLLLDTQGSNARSQNSQADDAIMCCLSMWMSSVYICNVLGNHAADLVCLPPAFAEFAVQFCQDAGLDIGGPLFQNLLFLGRDWRHYGNYPYGLHQDENSYTDAVGLENAPPEKNVINHLAAATAPPSVNVLDHHTSFNVIRRHWADVSAFLLPVPSAAISSNYDGKFCLDGDADFRSHLSSLAEFLFHGSYLRPRRLYGKTLTGHDLRDIMMGWAELFQLQGGLVRLCAISEVTAERHLLAVEHAAEKRYELAMSDVSKKGLNEQNFKEQHDDCYQESLALLSREATRFGGTEIRLSLQQKLTKHIESQHDVYKKINGSLQVEFQLRKDVEMLGKKLAEARKQIQSYRMKTNTQRLKIRKLEDDKDVMESMYQNQQVTLDTYKSRLNDLGMSISDGEASDEDEVREIETEKEMACPCQNDRSTCCCREKDDSKTHEREVN